MLTVLLVDDDAEFTEVAFCTIIEFLGHEVLTAATLKEARDWLEKETLTMYCLISCYPMEAARTYSMN